MKGETLHQEERILQALASRDHALLSNKHTLTSLSDELDIPARVLNRTLVRMEHRRLLASEWSTDDKDRRRPKRKRYFITTSGLNSLTKSQEKSWLHSNT